MEVMRKDIYFSKDELISNIFDSNNSALSKAGIYKRIKKMITNKNLQRISKGMYTYTSKEEFIYKVDSAVGLKVLRILKKNYYTDSRYIVYDSNVLNMFLNHLIANNTIIIEVEKDLVESVFWCLKDNGFKNVLLNPSENENYLYNPYNGSGIIVKTMVSKAPIDNKKHRITIEKLIVDIICDETLKMFYEGAEIQTMIEEILNNYIVKYDSVRNYAKRRNCYEKLLQLLPEKVKGAFND